MSGTIRVELGQPAPLQLQLPDGNATAAVKCSVFDATNTEITGSPFVLTSAGLGRYSNLTGFVPPAVGNYLASYTVYKDNGYNLVLARYSRAIDEFEVNTQSASTALEISDDTAIIAAVASVKSDTSSIAQGIQALSNAAGFALPIPATVGIPTQAVGSERIRVPFTVYKNGVNADVDSGTQVVCSLVNQNGLDRSAYLLGSSMGIANATHISLGNYYIDLSIPYTAVVEQLTLMLAYYLNGSLITRAGITNLVLDTSAAGFALQTTLLDVQTKVADADAILNNMSNGNVAIAQAVAANTAAVAAMEGVNFNATTDSLHAISQILAKYLHTGGRMVP
jgi:hypothetical protein